MTTAVVSAVRSAIEAAGLDRVKIQCANNDLVLVGDSESTKLFWDDGNECLWYIRIAAGTQPKDPRSMIFGCVGYEQIEIISVPGMGLDVLTMAESAGLSLTEELTTWIKTESSQAGLYPVQNKPPIKDGKPVTHETFIPSVK